MSKRKHKQGWFYHSLLAKCNLTKGKIIILLFLLALIFGSAALESISIGSKFNAEGNGSAMGALDGSKILGQPRAGAELLGSKTEEHASGSAAVNQPVIDQSDWVSYQNDWYGFQVKHPKEWGNPIAAKRTGLAKWEYSYAFGKKTPGASEPYVGFKVYVYNVSVVKEIKNTGEFPLLKNPDTTDTEKCATIEGHLTENEAYPAEEIYIPSSDNCYMPAYFYSLTRDKYVYNIVPIPGKGFEGDITSRDHVREFFPEFAAAATTFNLIDIKRPKPKPPAPKITAPIPASYKKVGGKLVCAKKKDKPRKSKQGKGKHLDMECCLDPDEYPNPHCTY